MLHPPTTDKPHHPKSTPECPAFPSEATPQHPLSGAAMAQVHLFTTRKFLEETNDTGPQHKTRRITKIQRCKEVHYDEWLKRSQECGFQVSKELGRARAKLASHSENLAEIERANTRELYPPAGNAFHLSPGVALCVPEYRIPVSHLGTGMKVLEAPNEVTKQKELLEVYKKDQEGKVCNVKQADSQMVGESQGYEADIEEDEEDSKSSPFWLWDEDGEDAIKMGNATADPPGDPQKDKPPVTPVEHQDSQSAIPLVSHKDDSDPGEDYSPPSPRDDTTPPQDIMDSGSDIDNNITYNRPSSPVWKPLQKTTAGIAFYYRTLHEYNTKYEPNRATHALYDTRYHFSNDSEREIGLESRENSTRENTQRNSPPLCPSHCCCSMSPDAASAPQEIPRKRSLSGSENVIYAGPKKARLG